MIDRIKEIENLMKASDFWNDKQQANQLLDEYYSLKKESSQYSDSKAILQIISGSGGLDSEEFVKMLSNMYINYLKSKKIPLQITDLNPNTQNGYKNITILVGKEGSYKLLESESGVHRLVRNSPFNTKAQRHTSFALVNVIPQITKQTNIDLDANDLEISFSNASGPGGQNVNKRETAVRVLHKPTNLSVRVQNERSQIKNKEIAFSILKGKLKQLMEQQQVEELDKVSKVSGQQISWSNQIRNYVLNPYKLVKDLRTGYETKNVDAVFEGDIHKFINPQAHIV